MNDGPTIPPDDPQRDLVLASPDDDQTLTHVGVVGDTYTILLTGEDIAGRYTLIDMHVPPGGGPPPHRHDFEEMFTVLDVAIGVPLSSRTDPAPALDEAGMAEFAAKAAALAPRYKTELLRP